jgi:hypothetical protein
VAVGVAAGRTLDPFLSARRFAGVRAIALLAALATGACAPRGPVVDTGAKPPDVGGTIAGIVRADAGAVSLAGRKVTAINQASGARFEATTGTDGGYTIKVPIGTYRLDVELRAGETLTTRPDPTQVSTGDLDPDRNFVIAPGR